jgi:hypothetical protein
MNKIIGYIIFAFLLAFVFIMILITQGWKTTLIIFGTPIVILWLCVFVIYLNEKK